MIQQHPRSGPPHDHAYAPAHLRTVAVDRAFLASGLGVAELAPFETAESVVTEFLALGAQGHVALFLSAVEAYHLLHCPPLPLYLVHRHHIVLSPALP